MDDQFNILGVYVILGKYFMYFRAEYPFHPVGLNGYFGYTHFTPHQMLHFENYHKTLVISKHVNIFDKLSILTHDKNGIKYNIYRKNLWQSF